MDIFEGDRFALLEKTGTLAGFWSDLVNIKFTRNMSARSPILQWFMQILINSLNNKLCVTY